MKYDWKEAMALRRADAAAIARVRTERLRAHLAHAAGAPGYAEMFAAAGVDPATAVPGDLARLPLLDRATLEARPERFIPPRSRPVDLAMTSGTTGRPLVVPYTKNDLERLAFNEEMGFRTAGVSDRDTALLTVTLDRCFVAGLAYYSGLTRIGAAVIRSGPGQPARQWELIERFRPSLIVGVPSFLMALAAKGRQLGIDPAACGVEKLVTIGEPLRKADHGLTPLGRDLAAAWGAALYSSYGSTEMETAACECSAGRGAHVHPELLIVEIVDEAGRPVADGEAGEVVVTPLGVEGLPLVRFRTGDVARLHRGPCGCGLNTERLGAIEGRLAQRLKVKGTTIYPEMIFQALQEVREIGPVYIEARNAYDLSDEVTVVAGCDDAAVKADTIADMLRARLRVRPEVVIKSRKEVVEAMDTGGRKPTRFFDFRRQETGDRRQ